MKIFISTDMEGVAGVVSWNEMKSNNKIYTTIQNTELNWVIELIKESKLNEQVEEIVICDSHSRGENLPFGGISDHRVSWIRGYPRPFYMMQGLDNSFDLVMLLGYHGKVGSFRAGMDHTYAGSCIYNIRLNGKEVGETEINAYYAGVFGVPVGLITGDDVLEKQVKEFFGNDFPFVRTKEGIGRFSAKVYHPVKVKEAYEKAFEKLLEQLDSLEVKKLNGEITLEVDLVTTVVADAVAIIPGLTRTSGRTVRYTSTEYLEIFRMILAIAMLGGRFANYE